PCDGRLRTLCVGLVRRVLPRACDRCRRAAARAAARARRVARTHRAPEIPCFRIPFPAKTPSRKRRLILICLILGAGAVAATLTAFALQQNMTYLYSPSEVEAGHVPDSARFRLGGVVLEDSIRRRADSLTVDFVVTDRFHEIPVEYTGILPDLFREGQSVI